MDVFKASFGVALLFVLSACGNAKSTDSVYKKSASPYCAQTRIQSKYIVEWEDGRFSTEFAESEEDFKENFLKPRLAEIRGAEPDYVAAFNQPVRTSSAQRTFADSQSWGQEIIEASSAWSRGYSGQNVIVGVVDSFVDVTHPQLQGNILVNNREIPGNGIDDDGNGYVDDVTGYSFVSQPGTNPNENPHGTHVSGIIAADPTFGRVKGVAPQAKIIPAPFISNDGNGSLGDAILAMQYVASRGARIINASWGGAPCASALGNAFVKLSSQGILLIVAAGNSGIDIDQYPVYPASFLIPNQLTVAASTSLDFMASWSNNGYQGTHLAAPGAQILSTVPGNSYGYMDGTSMAAPFVTGAAAVLWSARPDASAAEIRQALIRSVDISPGHEFRVASRGRLNLRKALEELQRIRP